MEWGRYDGWGVMAPAYTILPHRNVPTCGGKFEPTAMIRGGGDNTPVYTTVYLEPPSPSITLGAPLLPLYRGSLGEVTNNNTVPN